MANTGKIGGLERLKRIAKQKAAGKGKKVETKVAKKKKK
jgi:hypothetical protein